MNDYDGDDDGEANFWETSNPSWPYVSNVVTSCARLAKSSSYNF